MASPNEESASTEPKKAGGSKKGLYIGGIAVIVAASAGGGAFWHVKNSAPADDKGKAAESAPVEAVSEEEAANSLISLAPFVVNLNDDQSGEMHYLKCIFSVQLTHSKFAKTLENKTPKLRNDLIFFLSNLKVTETEGLENKQKILSRARDVIQTVVGKEAISDVYMTEFVIQ